jgi:hypothetical protein
MAADDSADEPLIAGEQALHFGVAAERRIYSLFSIHFFIRYSATIVLPREKEIAGHTHVFRTDDTFAEPDQG